MVGMVDDSRTYIHAYIRVMKGKSVVGKALVRDQIHRVVHKKVARKDIGRSGIIYI